MTTSETAGKYPKSDSRVQGNSENGPSEGTSDRNGSHDRSTPAAVPGEQGMNVP